MMSLGDSQSLLDNAIAVAATEFNAQRDNIFADKNVQANERLGFFAHELRNHLNSATLALTAIKSGSVGLTGATGAVLDRSLVALRRLIDLPSPKLERQPECLRDISCFRWPSSSRKSNSPPR